MLTSTMTRRLSLPFWLEPPLLYDAEYVHPLQFEDGDAVMLCADAVPSVSTSSPATKAPIAPMLMPTRPSVCPNRRVFRSPILFCPYPAPGPSP